jgi:hypothetical protein
MQFKSDNVLKLTSRGLTFLLFFSLHLNLFAQVELPVVSSHIKRISAQPFGDRILVSWTTKANYYCTDVQIYYGNDSNDLASVGRYPGICGDTTEKDYHFWIDEPVFNQVSYVKIWIDLLGYSDLVSVNIFKNSSSGLFIFPHPADASSIMVFPEETKFEYKTITILNAMGVEMKTFTTQDDNIKIEKLNLPKGLFYYLFTSESGKMVQGKIIVKE